MDWRKIKETEWKNVNDAEKQKSIYALAKGVGMYFEHEELEEKKKEGHRYNIFIIN